MNKQRRKALEELHSLLTDVYERVEAVMEEEQEAYDNLPENLQESERGEAMSDAISNLESAASSIDEAMDYLEEAQQ